LSGGWINWQTVSLIFLSSTMVMPIWQAILLLVAVSKSTAMKFLNLFLFISLKS
jgi:hypothetical protein